MSRRITVFMLALLLCSASTARASLIQWQLNGAVSANGGGPFPGPGGIPFDSIPVGMPAIFDFSFSTDLPNSAAGPCGPGHGLYDAGNAGWLSLAGRQYNAHLFVESNNAAGSCNGTGGEVEMRVFWNGISTIIDPALAAMYPPLWGPMFGNTLDDWMRLPHADQLGALPTTINPNPFPTTLHIFNGITNERMDVSGQLTAVPEPTSLFLLGTGLLAALRRRPRE